MNRIGVVVTSAAQRPGHPSGAPRVYVCAPIAHSFSSVQADPRSAGTHREYFVWAAEASVVGGP